jgi:hypothetical protein
VKVLAKNETELVVITQDERTGVILLWTPAQAGVQMQKVFEFKSGKKVFLTAVPGWWQRSKKDAKYCEYYQLWLGEYPYSSWAISIRKCKVTQEVDIRIIDTEINGRGVNPSDGWEAECQAYVPERVLADL